MNLLSTFIFKSVNAFNEHHFSPKATHDISLMFRLFLLDNDDEI